MADSLGVERLYVRVFDVEADGTATPPLAGWAGAGNREIVPVVYVVNGALLQPSFLPADAASSLLARVSAASLGPWKEMQVGPWDLGPVPTTPTRLASRGVEPVVVDVTHAVA